MLALNCWWPIKGHCWFLCNRKTPLSRSKFTCLYWSNFFIKTHLVATTCMFADVLTRIITFFYSSALGPQMAILWDLRYSGSVSEDSETRNAVAIVCSSHDSSERMTSLSTCSSFLSSSEILFLSSRDGNGASYALLTSEERQICRNRELDTTAGFQPRQRQHLLKYGACVQTWAELCRNLSIMDRGCCPRFLFSFKT